jgi:cyclophilin family peptidyl-prolyl cis-trans isomerase
MDIGERREEAVFIRFGLYGDDCPSSVKQMLQFLTTGLSSMDKETLDNSIGIQTAPVSLIEGGAVPNICSGKAVDFGVPSQSKAYAKSRGLRAAGPNFVPQTPPPSLQIEDEFPRTHSVAGLVSVPAKGIGYAGATEDDEAYSSAFLITADEVPALDKMGRRVIGQVIDAQSMQFLARLASLPVQRGKNGIIPGQTSGPPLLKVRVRDVGVQKVKSKKEKSKK